MRFPNQKTFDPGKALQTRIDDAIKGSGKTRDQIIQEVAENVVGPHPV